MTTQDYSQPVVLADDARLLDDDAVETANIADNQVTLAKLATIATATLLGRSTAGTGNVEALSVSAALTLLGLAFFVANAADKGDILVYDGADWVRLPAGTTGQVLTIDGAGLPSWV